MRILVVALILLVPSVLFAQDKKPNDPIPEWQQLLDEFLTWDIFNIEVWRLAAFLGLVVLALFLKNFLVRRLLAQANRILERSSTDLDNMLLERAERPLQWIAFVGISYVAVVVVRLPDGIHSAIVLVLQTLGTAYVGWLLYRCVDVLRIGLNRFTGQTESEMDDHLVPLVSRVIRVILITVVIITVVQQWGYDVTSLIAGLGIGGLAVALAAQDTLGNWFGGIMIFTDRPFKPGDWVKSGKIGEGVVETVGLRSTKVRTFDQSLVTVPNKDVANAAVENFSEMGKRRINTKIGLIYDTTPAQMRAIIKGIHAALETHEMIENDTYTAAFSGYGDSALEISLNAYVTTTEFKKFIEARQDLFLSIMDVVHDNKSGFAFPTTSVVFENSLETKAA